MQLADRWGLLPAFVFVLLVPLFFLGERFEVNDGQGHDGVFYVEVTRDFGQLVWKDGVSPYRVQRLFVPAVLHYGARLGGVTLTRERILEWWRWLDVACVALAVGLWIGIAGRLELPRSGIWFGATCLVVNFAVLKWSAFYANLMDMPALLEAVAMVWCWFGRRQVELAVVTVAGAFTWPTAIYLGALLLAFPKEDAGEARPSRGLALALAAAPALVLVGLLRWFEGQGGVVIEQAPYAVNPYTDLGILLAGAYVFAGLHELLRDSRLADPRWLAARVASKGPWLATLLVALVKAAQVALASAAAPGESQRNVVSVMIWSAAVKPAAFLVAHAVFYGPLVIVALLYWPRVAAAARRAGAGMTAALAFALPITIASESRQLVNFVPLFVPFVAQAVVERRWTRRDYLVFVALAVVGSKVWLRINPDWIGNLYRLNAGPWFSEGTYLVQGALVLWAAAWMARWGR